MNGVVTSMEMIMGQLYVIIHTCCIFISKPNPYRNSSL